MSRLARYTSDMALFEWTLVLLLGAVILTGLAWRVSVPYPSLLALAGAALAFVPAGPELDAAPAGSFQPLFTDG